MESAPDEEKILRILNTSPWTNTALTIEDTNLSFRVISSCAGILSWTPAVFEGNGLDSVITISSTGGPVTVSLDTLHLTSGGGSYGGGLDISGAVDVRVTNSSIYQNSASRMGGGVRIKGEAASIHLADSTLSGNLSFEGGGIACWGGASVSGSPGTTVDHNEAVFSGGGIHQSGCQLTLVGTDLKDNLSGWGAGLFAYESEVYLAELVIARNDAIFAVDAGYNLGGGVYAFDSTITARDVRFEDNQAGLDEAANAGDAGGGLFLDVSTLVLEGSFLRCLNGDRNCSTVTQNRSHQGAGIYVAQDSDLILRRVSLNGNDGTFDNGRVAHSVIKVLGDATLEGIFSRGNSAFSWLETQLLGQMTVAFSTLVDNDLTQVFPTERRLKWEFVLPALCRETLLVVAPSLEGRWSQPFQ